MQYSITIAVLALAGLSAALPVHGEEGSGTTIPLQTETTTGATATGTTATGTTASADFKEITAGKNVPLTLQLKDLNSGWRRMAINAQSDMRSYGGDMGMYQQILSQLGIGVYFTQGQTVMLGSETYLIAYRPQLDAREVMQEIQAAFDTHNPDPQAQTPRKMAAETKLALSLLNLRTLGSLNDIRPFDPAQDMEKVLNAKEANAASLENLRQLGVALVRYRGHNADNLPPMQDAATVRRFMFPYPVRRVSVFLHPGTREPYRPNPALSRKRWTQIQNRSSIVAFYEASVASDGTRGVLYLDGRVARIPEAQWPQVWQASQKAQQKPPPKSKDKTKAAAVRVREGWYTGSSNVTVVVEPLTVRPPARSAP